MLDTKAARGVCSACKHDRDCVYQATSFGVILQCEEFEPGFPAQAPRRSSAQPRALFSNAMDTDGYAGLCPSCENRLSCTYTRPEGGVWHCDEYV